MNATGEAGNRKTELALACETAMPQEMGVDNALRKIEAQARHEIILELFPDEFSIGFLVFHGLRSSVHPAFVIPNPCAFGRVRDLLFVCLWHEGKPGSENWKLEIEIRGRKSRLEAGATKEKAPTG